MDARAKLLHHRHNGKCRHFNTNVLGNFCAYDMGSTKLKPMLEIGYINMLAIKTYSCSQLLKVESLPGLECNTS